MQILRCRSTWPWLVFLGCSLFSAGCGGDAYEKQFDESLQHLKATGQPLGQPEAPPQPAANGDQQPEQQQQQN